MEMRWSSMPESALDQKARQLPQRLLWITAVFEHMQQYEALAVPVRVFNLGLDPARIAAFIPTRPGLI